MLSLCFCVRFTYYVVVLEPAVAMHLSHWYDGMSALSMMFVNIILAVCMLVGMVV